MTYLIIDTSSILFGFAHNSSVFEIARIDFPSYRQLVSKGIISELSRISKNRGGKGSLARVALKEIKAKNVNVDNIKANADSWILERASELHDSIVITNDTALAKRLLGADVKVFKLALDGTLKRLR